MEKTHKNPKTSPLLCFQSEEGESGCAFCYLLFSRRPSHCYELDSICIFPFNNKRALQEQSRM